MTVKVNQVEVDTAEGAGAPLAAVQELLRQRAVEAGLLADGDTSDTACNAAIEALLQQEVSVPEPTKDECRRWYQTHRDHYRSGELVHARHILFQILPGTPVLQVKAIAEDLLRRLQADPGRFADSAREHSNCPSGAQGGELGQLQRGSTVPEFESAVFDTTTTGLLPALVHSRHGFHIVAVDERIPGEPLPFEAVAERIAEALHGAAEERALSQYVRILAADAELEGVDLDAAESPLLQ